MDYDITLYMSDDAKKKIVLILHDIRSVHNVGSIFRTSDAIGVDTIYLTGYTPSPLDRFGRKRKDLAKVALGAEGSVRWVVESSIDSIIIKLKKDGYTIGALEQHSDSIDYKKYKTPKKLAFILGNEPEGIDEKILKKCDKILEIPMCGEKESLNVSVATGIVLYRLLDI